MKEVKLTGEEDWMQFSLIYRFFTLEAPEKVCMFCQQPGRAKQKFLDTTCTQAFSGGSVND